MTLEKKVHAGSIFDATWSPDGTKILTASADKSCKIVDAATLNEQWAAAKEAGVDKSKLAVKGTEAVAKALIEAGADVHKANNDGRTPLYLASQNGHEAVVKFLLGKGGRVNHVCENGATPLYLAAQNGYASIAHILIDQGANVNQATEGGFTPLYVAVEHNNLAVARLLLDNGANIHDTANEGVYPASVFVCPASVSDVTNHVVPGATALYMAAQEGHETMAQLLLDRGAHIDRKSVV